MFNTRVERQAVEFYSPNNRPFEKQAFIADEVLTSLPLISAV